MTVDRYTKLLLTVIALELGWIAIEQHRRAGARPSEPSRHPSSFAASKGLPGKQVFIPVTVVGSTVLRVESATAARGRRLAPVQNRGGPVRFPVETGSRAAAHSHGVGSAGEPARRRA